MWDGCRLVLGAVWVCAGYPCMVCFHLPGSLSTLGTGVSPGPSPEGFGSVGIAYGHASAPQGNKWGQHRSQDQREIRVEFRSSSLGV